MENNNLETDAFDKYSHPNTWKEYSNIPMRRDTAKHYREIRKILKNDIEPPTEIVNKTEKIVMDILFGLFAIAVGWVIYIIIK